MSMVVVYVMERPTEFTEKNSLFKGGSLCAKGGRIGLQMVQRR